MIEQIAPSDAVAEQASRLIDVRRYSQAIELLSASLSADPSNVRLLFLRAVAAHCVGNPDGAYEDVCAALRLQPTDYSARRFLAYLLVEKKKFSDAEEILIGLLKEYPKDAELYARYAALMLRTALLEKAAALNSQALSIDPSNETALVSQHLLSMINGQNAAAEEAVGELIQAHPESASVAIALINHLMRQGKYRAARRIAIGLLASSPTQPAYLNLVKQFTYLAHWSMEPLWPFVRWGRLATGAFCLVSFAVIRIGAAHNQELQTQLLAVFIGCIIYINVWPRILKRWIDR